MKENEKRAVGHAFDGAAALLDKDYVRAAASFVRGAMEVVSPDAVRAIVNEETIKRANAIADAIEGERFGR